MKLKVKDYKGLFKMNGGLTCLHSEFLVKGSLGLGDALVVCKQGNWRSFINKKGENKCLKKGYEIFSDSEKYNQYKKDFQDYIKVAKENVISAFSSKKNVSYKEFKELLPFFAKLWHFYGMTEFSYHDLAYKKMQENDDKVLKKNLNDLGKLKFKGREMLNSYIFENGALINFLRSIGNQFLNDEENTFYLFSNELDNLFNNKKISNKTIEERKKYYSCIFEKNKFQIFSPKESLAVWSTFSRIEESKKNSEIRGVIANKGIKRGKVIIIPMLVDMEKILKINSKMKKGNILVAESTTPELMPLCKKASAVVTDQGGMLSHAAIVSRELGIPCVIGTRIATQVLKDGDWVEVDAENGIIKILNK
jgi:phosphoenolpyruvate synthase/pyruvate phosphate dikinase